jgi:hypothetical protein
LISLATGFPISRAFFLLIAFESAVGILFDVLEYQLAGMHAAKQFETFDVNHDLSRATSRPGDPRIRDPGPSAAAFLLFL